MTEEFVDEEFKELTKELENRYINLKIEIKAKDYYIEWLKEYNEKCFKQLMEQAIEIGRLKAKIEWLGSSKNNIQ